MPCLARDDRRVAELAAGARVVDRALLRGDPGREARRAAARRAAAAASTPSRPRRRARGRACAGTLPSGGVTPWVAISSPTKSRNGERVAVGDEVGAPAAAVLGGAQQALDGVLDVRRRGQVAAAADPAERARARALDEHRQQRRVAAAPDEARAHDHRLERAAALLEHDLLGHRLRARVRRLRAQRERIASRRRARAAGRASAPPRC